MPSRLVLHASARGLALALVLIAGTTRAAEAQDAPTTSRFALRAMKTDPVPNASVSGRFAVTAQAQAQRVDSSGKRFALRGVSECTAGDPTLDRLFTNGFE